MVIFPHQLICCFLLFFLLFSCNSEQADPSTAQHEIDSFFTPPIDSPIVPETVTVSALELDSIFAQHDSSWINLGLVAPDILLDLRYATTNNFMELQIYDCPKCFVRLKAARELLNAHAELTEQGLGLKMYDCYRPRSAQLKLWQKKPDPRFVAPPSRGSMHSRGGALDLTIVDATTGEELDMGTDYDYFGREAYWVYKNLPDTVLANRQLLLKTMTAHGFKTVTTEWWHFSYRRAWFKLSDMEWPCE